ncbi:Phosphate-selective porin [Candidatus Ornithobacterium hominis]|uniref:porin n=1 Tax=Candidatus Ornithobacterium hominis TaxID=2497989 RepID=UPI000E5A7361|nr:porin [Candidatus Ornithobacterium hominis]SZD72159.1 Phosphate-selective porin [Candidatus Ornithobacterium hominis]
MKYFLIIYLAFASVVQAQATDSILAKEIQNKISAMPYYSYGKGIGITSPDSLYQMNIRFRMQSRITALGKNDETVYKATVRRLRLRFDGFVSDPKFQYVIQLSFPHEDMGTTGNNTDLNVVRDAMFFYLPNKHWQIGVGQTKLPGNRQLINSSGGLQLTDRSINNSTFNIDRDFGVQVYYLAKKKQGFDYNIKTAISTGEGRNFLHESDNALAYTARLELFPLGAFSRDGAFYEGDLAREISPKVMLSGSYQYNQDALRSNGQRGDLLDNAQDIRSLFLDAIAKYQGWALMLAYMQKDSENQIPATFANPKDLKYVFTGYGIDSQLSYLFRNNFEIIGRYSHQNPTKDVWVLNPKQNQFSLGVTKYISEHAFKLQTEITKTYAEYFNGTSEDTWFIRFQIELGI